MGEERYVGEELSKAREALRDAERLTSSGGTVEGVVNRLYYACFHAAQAALFDRGVSPSSNGAVRNLFGEHLVVDGPGTATGAGSSRRGGTSDSSGLRVRTDRGRRRGVTRADPRVRLLDGGTGRRILLVRIPSSLYEVLPSRHDTTGPRSAHGIEGNEPFRRWPRSTRQ